MTTWADLFERAASANVTTAEIRERLADLRGDSS